jgi:hypothetical protein
MHPLQSCHMAVTCHTSALSHDSAHQVTLGHVSFIISAAELITALRKLYSSYYLLNAPAS